MLDKHMILTPSGEGSLEKIILAEALGYPALAYQRVLKISPRSQNGVLGNRWLSTDGYHTQLKYGPKTRPPAGV